MKSYATVAGEDSRSDEAATSSDNKPENAPKAGEAGPGPEGRIEGAVDQWASGQDVQRTCRHPPELLARTRNLRHITPPHKSEL